MDIFCNLHVCSEPVCPAASCDGSNRLSRRAAEGAEGVVAVEGGFRVANLASMDVLNADFDDARPPRLGGVPIWNSTGFHDSEYAS